MKRQLIIATFAFAGALHGADDDNAYFEAKVLPLLQKRCYECHSHEKKIGIAQKVLTPVKKSD